MLCEAKQTKGYLSFLLEQIYKQEEKRKAASQVTYDSDSDSSELLPADYVVIGCVLLCLLRAYFHLSGLLPRKDLLK